ncbi:MAG TPA: S26 family signal peptidase [Candidatus Thermoplasmatota archaeon]|nr:S26 family signal peptidase [Candidatus Thermoplasmatota archaeon]
MKHGALRDALVLVGVFAGLLLGLYLLLGTWPPAVIVESGSMMHADDEVSYGRFGTIDPGDLVLVKKVGSVDDVTTLVEGGRDRYGKPGDVIVYHKGIDPDGTPIIHRAVAYIEVVADGYDVRWSDEGACEGGATKTQRDGHAWCHYGPEGVYIPSVPVRGVTPTSPYRAPASGFMTKGDNPVTNRQTDQESRLSQNATRVAVPVPLEWIEGKGRAEVPWLGLIKLSLAGKRNEANPPAAWVKVGSAYAPKDLWVMLGVTLFLVVGVPLLYDGYRAMQKRRGPKGPT